MSKLVGKNTSMLRVVQARASSREDKRQVNERRRMKQVPHLHSDWIFNILILLPIKSLQRLSCVCKAWFNLINSPTFIEEHVRRSETVLMFIKSIQQERPNTFSVEAILGPPKQFSIFPSSSSTQHIPYIHFLEMQDGKGRICELKISYFGNIVAACDGLILCRSKQNQGGLIVMNPITRKLMKLPLGTLSSRGESYGFMFSHAAREYKVVHLFCDETGYIGCEILSLSTRSWRAVDGPSFGLLRLFVHKPISAIGALHWVPDVKGNDYIVSMGIDDETFLTTKLPRTSKKHDRLVELGGNLSFVTHVEANHIEVWVLKDLCGKDWIKQHSISWRRMKDWIPVCTLKNGREMVFKRDCNNSFYVYDLKLQLMRNVEMNKECLPSYGSYLPHVNSLKTWTSTGASGGR